MTLRIRIHIILSLITAAVAGCRTSSPATPLTVPPSVAQPIPALTPAGVSQVERLLHSLSPREKVAQLVMPWITGTYQAWDDPGMQQILGWVDSLQVGGLIVSVGSPVEMAAKLNSLQRASRLPLLVASDLEGGTTIRFSQGGTLFPTQMGVAAGGRTQDAWEMGRITAIEGRAVGIHLAFAPVADVNSNPENPIINTRSFGANPQQVAEFVAATVDGMRAGGILSTAKHFPGHGDTDTDSHLSLPTITAPWARFDTLEMVPFRSAVAAGVDAIMSAHIAVPGLVGNSDRPGTLVPAVLTGLLRDSLHFGGLVVTDALNMAAIVQQFGTGEAAVLAFLAGSDLLLQPGDPAAVVSAMLAAVENGRITPERLDASVRRILELKQRLGLFSQPEVDLSRIPAIVGQESFQQIGREVTARAMVLLKDSLNLTGRMRQGPQRITLLVRSEIGSTLGNTMAVELRRQGHAVTLIRVAPSLTSTQASQLLDDLSNTDLVLYLAAVRAVARQGNPALTPEEVALLTRLNPLKPVMLISFGSPYLIAQLPWLSGYAIGWSNHPVAESAMAAALGGLRPFTGKLPIPVPPSWSIGSGINLP